MIDRKRVIKRLEIIKDNINEAIWFGVGWGSMRDISVIDDAMELLKADQYYLQKLTEHLQLIADIAYDYDGYRASKKCETSQLMEIIDAIRGLPEVKDD